MGALPQRLSIVTLGVSDMARSKAFYLDGLGWTEVEQDSPAICFIQMSGMVLGLYGWDALAADMGLVSVSASDLPQFRGTSLAYNTSSEPETDAVIDVAVAAGAKLIKSPERVFWGGYSGYFCDPDGHLWEVAFNPYTLPSDGGRFEMTSDV